METGVKLQVGKWYRRRDGEVVGPVKECNFHRTGKYPFVAGGSTYTADGRYYYNNNATIFDLVEEVPAPTAQPEPPAAKPAWQPISTAPRDGTLFLAWDDLVRQMAVCIWVEECQRVEPFQGTMFFTDQFGHNSDNITHWMALPEAPGGE